MHGLGQPLGRMKQSEIRALGRGPQTVRKEDIIGFGVFGFFHQNVVLVAVAEIEHGQVRRCFRAAGCENPGYGEGTFLEDFEDFLAEKRRGAHHGQGVGLARGLHAGWASGP